MTEADAPKNLAVEFDYKPADYLAYLLHFNRNSALHRRQRSMARFVFPIVMIPLGMVFIAWKGTEGGLANLWLFYFLFIALFATYVWIWFGLTSPKAFMAMMAQGKNRGIFGAGRIELRDDSIWQRKPLGEDWMRWEGVERIDQADDHIFVQVGVGSSYVIPKRAFGNIEASQAFVDRALKLWCEARLI